MPKRPVTSHETMRLWRNRFEPMFAAKIKKKRTASIHSSLHNHFNQDRHLYNRRNFKLNRSTALAEWRQLAA